MSGPGKTFGGTILTEEQISSHVLELNKTSHEAFQPQFKNQRTYEGKHEVSEAMFPSDRVSYSRASRSSGMSIISGFDTFGLGTGQECRGFGGNQEDGDREKASGLE